MNSGVCECGCGNPTSVIKGHDPRRGLVKGEYRRFVNGHNRIRGPITADDYTVEDRGFTSPCWEWSGTRQRKGYGVVKLRGVQSVAHRAMWKQERGPIPDGFHVDHLCVNPPCINPDHLEPVDHTTNVRRSRRTKITNEQVIEMRALRAQGLHFDEIGALYGVTSSCAHYSVMKRKL